MGKRVGEGGILKTARKHLFDMEQAAALIARFTEGKTFAEYGYAQVDDRLGWDLVESKLPTLRREVEELRGKE